MGARVELLEPFTTPWGAKNFSFPSKWVVTYRSWNHCRKEQINENISKSDTALLGMTKSFGDILTAFAFGDLAAPMELGEALTLGYALNIAQLGQETISQVWESEWESPPTPFGGDSFQELFPRKQLIVFRREVNAKQDRLLTLLRNI